MVVSIVGTSAITPAGVGVEALLHSVIQKKSLMKNGLGKIPEIVLSELRELFPEMKSSSEPVLLAYASAKLAMKKAGWSALNADDVIIFATTVGLGPVWESILCHSFRASNEQEKTQLLSETLRQQPIGNLLSQLSQSLKFSGRSYLISSACTAGTQAAGLAAKLIASRRASRCLVVGVEVFCQLTLEGFKSLRLLTEEACRPFDKERGSINLSEAAAALCLEDREDHERFSNIVGFGMSSDAFHAASPEPAGEGIVRAMNLSLKDGNLKAKDVEWIHCHGTGSLANDSAEACAIDKVFIKQGSSPFVCSTKGVHGHSLAASGVLELSLVDAALREGIVLANYPLDVVAADVTCELPKEAFSHKVKYLMKTTLGFGGANASVILKGPL